MASTVRDAMTSEPVVVEPHTTLTQAAHAMADDDIGAVLMRDGAEIRIVTDRDIVTKGLGADQDPREATVGDVCSAAVTVGADEDLDRAVDLFREHAIQRLVVLHDDQIAGVLSMADVARARDERSALGDVGSSPPNA